MRRPSLHWIPALALVAAVWTPLTLQGCATSDVASRGVIVAEQLLTTAETLAKNYTDLPRCGSIPARDRPLCSDAALVAKMAEADNRAYDTVRAARQNEALIDAALAAITDFQSLIPRR